MRHPSVPRRTLATWLAALAAIATFVVPVSPAAAAETACSAGTATQMRNQALQLVNRERRAVGVPPLTLHRDMNVVAQRWTREMVGQSWFRHNPNWWGSYPSAALSGGENVAWHTHPDTTSVRRAHDGFVASSGHYANMVRRGFTHVGFGVICVEPRSYPRGISLSGFAPQLFLTQNYLQIPLERPAPATSVKLRPSANGTLRLRWEPARSTTAAPVHGYRIALDGTQVRKLGPRATSVDLSGLRAGRTYTVRIRSFNSEGNSRAVERTARAINRPAAPGSVRASSPSSGRVAVSWSAAPSTRAAPVRGYRIRCVSGCSSTGVLATASASAVGHTLSGMPRGKKVTIRVVSYNAAGRSAVRDVSLRVRR